MLRIPLDRLPSEPSERHSRLRNYFCDKDAEALADDSEWHLRLFWPNGEERHVDPRLDEGLAWWGEGVSRSSMAAARRKHGRVLSVLYDTWTLHSWSKRLTGSAVDWGENILILHVDDHQDLGTPRVFIDDNGWRDALTNSKYTFDDPASVLAAIESGALGMGSFLTPFLHRFPQAEVRHLCQPPKANQTLDFRIKATTISDDLLEPGRPRPAVELEPIATETGPGCYRMTPNTQEWLDCAGLWPALLHIDMDYFCNRFDGDSDWRSRLDPLDPDLDTILAKIDEIVAALRHTGIGTRIEDVVTAYSPGFFPAEFWAPAEARLRPALEALYEH